jgi:hypothetical protein
LTNIEAVHVVKRQQFPTVIVVATSTGEALAIFLKFVCCHSAVSFK